MPHDAGVAVADGFNCLPANAGIRKPAAKTGRGCGGVIVMEKFHRLGIPTEHLAPAGVVVSGPVIDRLDGAVVALRTPIAVAKLVTARGRRATLSVVSSRTPISAPQCRVVVS
tara:strand:+ start:3131 stop:3469 length:339 start_codon:yes stop_codon:yes gene_type:complete